MALYTYPLLLSKQNSKTEIGALVATQAVPAKPRLLLLLTMEQRKARVSLQVMQAMKTL